MYVIKQAPRDWYYRLDKCFHQKGFQKGRTDRNLYIKFEDNDQLILVAYVDDIIFGSNIELMSKNFVVAMQQEIDIVMFGELSFFPIL